MVLSITVSLGTIWKWFAEWLCRKLPYQEKHALQQASLLGNLESFGLLSTKNGENADDRNGSANTGNKSNFAVVELGAGRGYLSHMLCDCYNVQNVVMIERRSYKFKVSPPTLDLLFPAVRFSVSLRIYNQLALDTEGISNVDFIC